jgi:hypothetical protein
MKITRLDRMLLSNCVQEIGKEIKTGEREVMGPCNNIQEFEVWRISFIDRLSEDPYDENESLTIPYEDLKPESRDYVDKIKN